MRILYTILVGCVPALIFCTVFGWVASMLAQAGAPVWAPLSMVGFAVALSMYHIHSTLS